MTAARALRRPPDPDSIDQRVRLHDVSWQAYEALLVWRGESSAVRITYLEGELELMTPAWNHEEQNKKLARLVEAWAEEANTPLQGAGSWTVRERGVARGAEPDECYVLDYTGGEPKAPDIAIEVIWTSGGIDKLDVWRKLGAREVWFWQDGALTFHVLRGARYAASARSALLPGLDPRLFVRCMAAPTQTEAVKQLRAAMRAPRASKAKRPRR